jgi:hypothetical protein
MTEPNSRLPHHHAPIAGLAKRALDTVGMRSIAKPASRLYRKFKYRQRRLPSHDYGMVGLVKQLIDELGMDAITNPERNGSPPQRFPKFQRIEVCPGQVFIVKATEHDDDLVAESLRHPFPKTADTVVQDSEGERDVSLV